MTATNIYDFVGSICTEIGVNYDFGSYKSVQKRLMNSARNGKPIASRYPLVMLVTSDKVEQAEVDPSLSTTYPLHLIIVAISGPHWNDQKRLDDNFKAVLYPIYKQLLEKLRRYSKNIYSELPHSKVDHFYYSASTAKEANKLAEYLDAIELTGLEIKLNFNENCTENE